MTYVSVQKEKNKCRAMDITAISDLHGFFPKDLPGGDLLIVAGDLTAKHTIDEFMYFIRWLDKQDYAKKVFIAGNHDEGILPISWKEEYLCDSGTMFQGLKIWGSPHTLTFPGINPRCTAFTGMEEELKAKFDLIPNDIDILITHGPPFGVLDHVDRVTKCGTKQFNVGSKSLMDAIWRIEPKLVVFGHIHEGYGIANAFALETDFFNCSHVNECYEPVNKPIRIVL